MKKLLLLVAVAVMSVGTMSAQDKPESFGNGPVDAYIAGAYDLTGKKTALTAALDQLEKDVTAAGNIPSKDQRVDFIKRSTDIEASYVSMPDDVKKMADTAKDAATAAKDCGMKAAKCTKAVKAATEQLTTIGDSIKTDAPRAAKLKAKCEAFAAVTK